MKRLFCSYSLLLVFWLCCCSSENDKSDLNLGEDQINNLNNGGTAQVTGVVVTGGENQYSFRVTIKSDETGCNQYVNWWEVIDVDGKLVYRKVLFHSHVDEQPFTRTGGPVSIESGRVVYVRAHMNNSGYSSNVSVGSPTSGFSTDVLSGEFAKELADVGPKPASCAY